MIGNCFGTDPIDREIEARADAQLDPIGRWAYGCASQRCEGCAYYGKLDCLDHSFEPRGD